jgi:hypothetical protein
MKGQIKMSGRESVPRWVLHGIESKVADCEFMLRERSHDPSQVTAYFLRQVAQNLAFVRELVREHGNIKTEFWYDLPPYTKRKSKAASSKSKRTSA